MSLQWGSRYRSGYRDIFYRSGERFVHEEEERGVINRGGVIPVDYFRRT